MKLLEKFGGKASGQATVHQQIADPIKQRRRIIQLGQTLFELFQFLNVPTAPQGLSLIHI